MCMLHTNYRIPKTLRGGGGEGCNMAFSITDWAHWRAVDQYVNLYTASLRFEAPPMSSEPLLEYLGGSECHVLTYNAESEDVRIEGRAGDTFPWWPAPRAHAGRWHAYDASIWRYMPDLAWSTTHFGQLRLCNPTLAPAMVDITVVSVIRSMDGFVGDTYSGHISALDSLAT